MKKNPKIIIAKVLIFVFVILIGIVLSQFFSFKKDSKIVKAVSFDQVILNFTQMKANLYEKGDLEGDYLAKRLNCPNYLKENMAVHSSFFECNPLFFLCKQKENETFKNHQFKFLGYDIARHGDLIVKYIVKGNAFQVKLKNTCRSTYLEQKLYNAGPLENEDRLWDNYTQSVYIDKNYFSHLDLQLSSKNKLENIENPHLPVLNLKKEQMQRACAGLGGQVMQSRYFDAAANFPSSVKNKNVKKFPYPWTKKRRLVEEELNTFCLKSYTSECKKLEYLEHADYSPSWIGTYHTLGGMMEFLDNKFFPSANIKISSLQIERDSIWNKNFLRGSIEESDEIKKYNGISREFLKVKDWAFRCIYFN